MANTLETFSALYNPLTPDAKQLFPRTGDGGFNMPDIEKFVANPNQFFSGMDGFNGLVFQDTQFGNDLFDVQGNMLGSIDSAGNWVPFRGGVAPTTVLPDSGTQQPAAGSGTPTQQLPPPGAGSQMPSTGYENPFFQILSSNFGQSATMAPFMDFDRSGVLDFQDFIQFADRFNQGSPLFLSPEDFAPTGVGAGSQGTAPGIIPSTIEVIGADGFPTEINVTGLEGLGNGININGAQSLIDAISGGIGVNTPQSLIDAIQGGIGVNPGQNLIDLFTGGININTPTIPNIGIDTGGLNLPDIGISSEALTGLGQFADALNAFGNFNLDNAVEARINPLQQQLAGLLQNVQGFIDSYDPATQFIGADGFTDQPDFTDPTNQTTETFQGVSGLPEIQDNRQMLTNALIDQAFGITGAQDLVGQELVGRLDASNPFSALSADGEDSVLNQVIGKINRQADKGRERLLNQFAVTNKLDQPIFKQQLNEYEGSVLDSIANATIGFGLQEAGAEEGIRRNRINDLFGFNQQVTGNLGNTLQQVQSNFAQDIGLQDSAINQALQNFLNTTSFNNTVGSSQAGFSDQGLGMALSFLGNQAPQSIGGQAASIFGNLANQTKSQPADFSMLTSLFSNPALFR